MFLESARFYELPRAHPRFEKLIGRLQEGRRVRVRLDGAVIEDVVSG